MAAFDERVQRIFFEALDRPPAEWDVYVTRASVGDAAVAREVRELLASHRRKEDGSRPLAKLAEAFADQQRPPRRLKHYEFERELGRGGMGVVHLALDTRLKRRVAIKLLRALDDWNSEAVLRFQRELAALGSTQHPHVVRALNSGVEEGWHYLIMEYLDGQPLDRLVQEHGALPPARAVRYALHAARGLEHLHQCRLIHRDVKPSNLMITSGDHVKVLDLGIALGPDLNKEFGRITTGGKVLGSLDYIAPEQQRGVQQIDHRVDLYALGATLHFLLSGQAPFAHHTTMVARLVANMEEKPPRLYLSGPTGAALQELVDRLLAKKPGDRPRDMGEAIAALERIAADLTARASTPSRRRPVRPRLKLALGLALATVIWSLAAVAIAFLWRSG